MKILLLADASSEHTEKWAVGLAKKGFEIGIFSINPPEYNWMKEYSNIQNFSDPGSSGTKQTSFSKIGYLKLIPKLKKIIRTFEPDVVHAHYATSYGILARLSGFKPYFISAWGTDVMKFPDKNFINRKILKKNLNQAAKVFATSNTIREYIHRIQKVEVTVIPFGVDLQQFKPNRKLPLFDPETIVIGAIKVLSPIYGMDILIDAFASVVKVNPHKKLGLLLVGEGPSRNELMAQCEKLGIQDQVIFTGRIDFSEVAAYFNSVDIFVNISEYESFGVSVIEASACEKPVIVTDVGGLKEVVDQNETGIRIASRDKYATAAAIERLIEDPMLRLTMGKNGRKKVEALYNWENNLEEMCQIYRNVKNSQE